MAIGDLHLQSDRPWGLKVSNDTVDWIINHSFNVPENTLVLLGDLTEKSTLSGSVYTLLLKLFTNLNYGKVFILVGNHDGNLKATGQPDLVYDFLKDPKIKDRLKTDIEIMYGDKPAEFEGIKMLFMSHIFNDGTHSNKDHEDFKSDTEFDVVFGHFTNTSLTTMGEKINIEHIKTKYHCFGHIHNPSEQYVGSLIPNSISEANQKRQIRTYRKVGGEVKQEILELASNICDYYTVNFPDPLPFVDSKNPIWTITNCKDVFVAKEHYGNIFIRSCVYDISMDLEAFQAINMKGQKTVSPLGLFDEFATTTKYEPEFIADCRKYLE